MHISLFFIFSWCVPSEYTDVLLTEHIVCARLSCKHWGFSSEFHRQEPCHYRASILVKDTDFKIKQHQGMTDAMEKKKKK